MEDADAVVVRTGLRLGWREILVFYGRLGIEVCLLSFVLSLPRLSVLYRLSGGELCAGI
jgi:hypothetical protein